VRGAAWQLIRIGKTHGVNALVDGQTLDIAAHGITVVYGDNGSGKSGYARVIKSIVGCAARSVGPPRCLPRPTGRALGASANQSFVHCDQHDAYSNEDQAGHHKGVLVRLSNLDALDALAQQVKGIGRISVVDNDVLDAF
jgi:energy-coupling factor transporter ATP-binding protein EcfA2